MIFIATFLFDIVFNASITVENAPFPNIFIGLQNCVIKLECVSSLSYNNSFKLFIIK